VKILILGYSDFAQRRIIPILLNNYKDFKIAIASKSKKINAGYKNIFCYNNYKNAIELFKPDIVYISLPNSLHYFWGKEVLKKSINLIIDKPITLKLNHLKELISLATKNRVVLAEATIFNYHPQIKEAIKIVGGISKIEVIQSNFCIPQPVNNNIKMSKILGGGVNHDMGPYAAGSFRIFFKNFPERIVVLSNKKNNIIRDLSVQAKFKDKISYSYFSFGREYKNDLLIFSKNKIIKINSVYSPNPSLDSLIEIRENNKNKEIFIKPHSTFKYFFEIFLNSVKRKNFRFFINDMLFDAKFREIINNQLK
jgi:predicted dehydrogenase